MIRNLVAPGKPADQSFSELVTLVRTHFRPSSSVTVQRYNFNSRSQRDGESVSQFVAELRKLSEHCDFGNTLEDMLRDRLVCGIRDIRVQRRLLAEPGLTFTKAFGLAQSAELAEKNVQDLQQSEGSPVHPVHKVEPAGKPWSGNCSRCGGKHKASDCRCKSLDCYKCGKRGHLARVCRSHGGGGSKGTRSDELSDERSGKKPLDTEKTETYALYNLSSSKSRMPLVQLLTVNGTPLQMQVDTGAVVSLISESTYMRVWPQVRRPALEKSGILLRTYTGEGINVVGKICVHVQHEGQNHRSLDLLVVQGRGPSLIGRDWLSKLKINLSLFYVGSSEGVEQLLERHATLFEGKLGLLEGMRVKIHVDKTVKPRFYKPRPVPYALRDKVEQELERLQRDGVIEPVRFSEWAAPVVPVVKSDGSLRICGDYKLTVNSAATVDSYPLPRIDDVLASMTGAKVFSKLDLSHAYLQLQLEEESKEFVTISTHKGLFRYNRLPFGIAAAPAIFQRTMEGILQDIPHVQVYIDDILVADSSREEHMKTLAKVLSRLQQRVYNTFGSQTFAVPVNEQKPIPTMASGRIQRWALTLSAYKYHMEYRAGKDQGNVDALSRLPVGEAPSEVPIPGDTVLMLQMLSGGDSIVTASAIRKWTNTDPLLSMVRRMVLQGWESQLDAEFKPYLQRRAPILKLLHEGHPGISRMKALARSVVWWPGLDAELEVEVKSCTALDSHSKWVEAAVVSSPSSQQAMRILRHTFATHGLPDILVSDNGAAFTSAEFQLFVKANGFRHVRSAPYHAATNGLAERAVQSLKNALKRMTGDVETGLARFLFQYRLTPHSTTGQSPAELLLGRKPKSHLDFVFPSLKNQVQRQQERQKDDHDRKASHRSFVVGERVYCLNHRGGLPKWLSGVIRSVQGPVTVVVKLEDGKESRYHIDHVRSRSHDSTEDGNETMTSQEQDAEEVGPLDPNMPPVPEQQQPPPPPMAVTPEPQRRVDPDYRPVPDPVPAPIPRRSTRPHHPPERFGW
eukprot:Em0376g4a